MKMESIILGIIIGAVIGFLAVVGLAAIVAIILFWPPEWKITNIYE